MYRLMASWRVLLRCAANWLLSLLFTGSVYCHSAAKRGKKNEKRTNTFLGPHSTHNVVDARQIDPFKVETKVESGLMNGQGRWGVSGCGVERGTIRHCTRYGFLSNPRQTPSPAALEACCLAHFRLGHGH